MKKIFGLLFSCLCLTGIAQNETINYTEVQNVENYGRFKFIEFKMHGGSHLYTGEKLENALDNGYGAFEIRYGWQPSNPEAWSSTLSYPSYGIGWYSGYIGDPDIFGNPNALFGFINFNLSRPQKRNSLEISPAFGITYNLKPYDEENNPENDAIGSKFAVYFSASIGGVYRLNREMDLTYGLDLTHFSNGRTYTPNYGLNMIGLNLGMRYHYNKDQKFVDKDPYTKQLLQARFKRPARTPRKKIKESSIQFYTAIGTVQNDEDAGTSKRYTTFSGVLDYRYQFNTLHAVTVGFDLFYDESLSSIYTDESDRYLTAAHIGYDFNFWKMAIRVQAGAYFGDDKGKDPIFLRPAVQYHILDWLHAQVGLKTKNGGAADWIEFGIGFTPFKW